MESNTPTIIPADTLLAEVKRAQGGRSHAEMKKALEDFIGKPVDKGAFSAALAGRGRPGILRDLLQALTGKRLVEAFILV